MDRKNLIDKLSLLEPALADNPFIQLFTHFWFDEDTVTAYEDRIGIQVKLDAKPGLRGCIPGKVLLGLLRSSSASEVLITEEKGWCIIKTKVMNAKLAMLPIEDARKTWSMPKPEGVPLDIPASVLVPALIRCLRSTTNDTGAPEQLGVTFDPGEELSLYSTDNHTLTRVAINTHGLQERVILPRQFCQQAVKLLDSEDKKPVDLRITDKHALLTTKKAKLFGRLILSEKPIDFAGQFSKYFPNKLRKSLVKIPNFMEAAIERSLIMATAGEGEARMTIECGDNRLKCTTRAVVGGKDMTGAVTDGINLDHPDVKASLNPSHLKAGMEFYNRMLVTDRALILTDDMGGTFLVSTSVE